MEIALINILVVFLQKRFDERDSGKENSQRKKREYHSGNDEENERDESSLRRRAENLPAAGKWPTDQRKDNR